MAEALYSTDGEQLPSGEPGLTYDQLLQRWRGEDERILAEHGGDADAANRALGLDNLAAKMQDQEETNAFLAEHPDVVRMHEQIFAMDPIDREALYPAAADDGLNSTA